MNIEGTVPLFIGMGYLIVRSLFGTVEKLGINALLRAPFIDRCICGMFPTER